MHIDMHRKKESTWQLDSRYKSYHQLAMLVLNKNTMEINTMHTKNPVKKNFFCHYKILIVGLGLANLNYFLFC